MQDITIWYSWCLTTSLVFRFGLLLQTIFPLKVTIWHCALISNTCFYKSASSIKAKCLVLVKISLFNNIAYFRIDRCWFWLIIYNNSSFANQQASSVASIAHILQKSSLATLTYFVEQQLPSYKNMAINANPSSFVPIRLN